MESCSSSCSSPSSARGHSYRSSLERSPSRSGERPALPWELSVRLGEEPPAAHEFEVGVGSRAAGHTIRDLPLGEHAWITLVVRDGAATRPGGSLELRSGDRVLLLAETDDLEPLSRIFAGAAEKTLT
jgi:NhaP-type Na+/H+ and K+/H+ antiporter